MTTRPAYKILVCALCVLSGLWTHAVIAEERLKPKPYDEVVNSKAKTEAGVFTVHRVKNRVYYEIPRSELNKNFLWVTRYAKRTFIAKHSVQPLDSRVVRWKQHGNHVLLCSVSYEVAADTELPIARAVEAENNDSILMAFDIEAFGKDEAPVVEVSKLFNSEVPEFSARRDLQAQSFDATRSFLERVTPYPHNIEVEVTQTYTNPIEHTNPSSEFGAMSGTSATVLMHYSMVELPGNPMQPRLFDARVGFGYFGTSDVTDYGREEHHAVKRGYIQRWRLEKKDPNAALSEPVKPIVYYIDSGTPEKWRPWIKRGIEDWQPAFEMAGFKNAIVVKNEPSPGDEPDWSPEDIRHSVVRWVPSADIDIIIPETIVDPRTGEILNAAAYVGSNSLNRLRDEYFVAMAPLDPRAQGLPFPDDLMGRLLEGFVIHELGHTLGLGHNLMAGATYPVDKLRNPDWLHKMGYVASIGSFPVFDYLVQPEDHVPPEDLIQRLGPYDKWVIRWGYQPIPGAGTPDAEKPTLDEWTREQGMTPWLQYQYPHAAYRWDPYHPVDPRHMFAGVGGSDAIYSTGLGLKNLQRVMDMVLEATSRPDEPCDDLKEIYGHILGHWIMEMYNVAVLVGGVESQMKYGGQSGAVFTPVSRDRQRAAVHFLNEQAFKTPLFLIRPEVMERIVPSGALEYIGIVQDSVLGEVLENARLARLADQSARYGAAAYRPGELLSDLREGIWSELAGSVVRIDPYRSQLQRNYVQLLAQKMNTPELPPPIINEVSIHPVELGSATSLEAARPYLQADLKTLQAQIIRALPKAAAPDTRAHLDALRDQIDRALDHRISVMESKRTNTSAGGS